LCKTTQYETALKQLTDTHLVVLTGNPGEGKTTIAAKLALAVNGDRKQCVQLTSPNQWATVNWGLGLFTTVIIDDIFGDVSLDHELVSKWKQYLPDIERLANSKELKFIITTRTYIMKEARQSITTNTVSMFNENSRCVVQLESAKLEAKEMEDILSAVLARKNMSNKLQKHNIQISDCVDEARRTAHCVIGFPQCCALFANKELIKYGSKFFLRPESLFKEYVQQLYNPWNPKQFYKFVTLVAVWAEETQTINTKDMLNPHDVSTHIGNIARHFDIQIDNEFVESMRCTMKLYDKFLIAYNGHTGEFKFTHSVIGEMVGVVLGQDKPKQCISLCQRDFLMERIVLRLENDDRTRLKSGEKTVVEIDKNLYEDLCGKFVEVMFGNNSSQREDQSPLIKELDVDLLKQTAFEEQDFVNTFIDYITKKGIEKILFNVKVKCHQLCNEETCLYLLDYVLTNELLVIAEHAINRIDKLLSIGTTVSGDALLITMQRLPDLVEKLIAFDGTVVNRKCGLNNESYTLIEGIKENLTSQVCYLMQHGADVNLKDSNGMTALHCAANNENLQIIEELLLLKYNADINAVCAQGQTPLHVAIRKRSISVTKLLLEKGVKQILADNENLTPLHLAVQLNYHDILGLLLQYKDAINIKGGQKEHTPLHMAVCAQNTDVVNMLLDHGVDLSLKDRDNMTVLHNAVLLNNYEIIKKLLQYKAEVNAIGGRNEESPLHMAVCRRNTDVVKMLLEHKEHRVDLSLQDKNSMTVLHCAVVFGKRAIIAELLSKGADVNIKGGYNLETPLHIAVRINSTNTVKKLLRSGADLAKKDKHNMTALHRAVSIGHLQITEELLKQHVDVNVRGGESEETPLISAVKSGDKTVVQMLLSKDANVSLTDDFNMTALHWAVVTRQESANILQMLLDKNADVNTQGCKYKETVLHIAARHPNLSAIEMLLTHGANLFLLDRNNMNAVHTAICCGHGNVVETMLRWGTENNVVVETHRISALHIALCNRDLYIQTRLNNDDRKQVTTRMLVVKLCQWLLIKDKCYTLLFIRPK